MRVNFKVIKSNIYNTNFIGKSIRVIVTDKDGNIKQYSSIREASEDLKIPKCYIYKCNEDGEKFRWDYKFDFIPQPKKELYPNNTDEASQTTDMPARKRNETPIYCIDKKGDYRRFPSIKQAEKTLELNSGIISSYFQHKGKFSNNFIFIYAKEVEHTEEDGSVTVDTNKIKKIYREYTNAARLYNVDSTYVINKNGTFKKYESRKETAKELGLPAYTISDYVKGGRIYKDSVIVSADDIEIKSPDGSVSINETKIKELCEKIKNKSIEQGVYIIDKNGNYKKFDKKTSAADAIGASHAYLYENLNGHVEKIKGYVCIRAKDFEIRDNNGNLTGINRRKLQDAIKILNPVKEEKEKKEKGTPVYIIEGQNYKRYNSMLSAAKELNITCVTLKNHLDTKKYKTPKGICIYAKDIETVGSDGKPHIDKEKLQNLFNNFEYQNNQIYIVDANGKYMKFNSAREAQEKLGINYANLNNRLKSDKKLKNAKYYCYRASDVEKLDENLNLTLDKIQLASKIGKLNPKAEENENSHEIYAIDSKGNYKLYSGITEAANKLWLKPWEIANCMGGKVPDVDGYKFIRANETDSTIKNAQNIQPLFYIYAVSEKGRVTKFKSYEAAQKATKIPSHVIKSIINNPEEKRQGCIFLSSDNVTKIDTNKGIFTDNKEKIKQIYYNAFKK